MTSKKTTRREFVASLPVISLAAAAVAGPRPGQPLPVLTIVTRLDDYTAITRQWKEGDARRCRLCDRCDAEEDTVCTVLVNQAVSDAEAATYSTRGFTVA